MWNRLGWAARFNYFSFLSSAYFACNKHCSKNCYKQNTLNTSKNKVKSYSQSQIVPQNLRTQNTELVAVAQTLQGAFLSVSLLHTDCRVSAQAIQTGLKGSWSSACSPHLHNTIFKNFQGMTFSVLSPSLKSHLPRNQGISPRICIVHTKISRV